MRLPSGAAPTDGVSLPSLYDLLRDVLPSDHARQSSARAEIEARLKAGFAPKTILDLGCGAGDSVAFFRRSAPRARWIGVDIALSPEVLERTRQDAEFVTFDGVNLPFPAADFDLVFSHQVFEHVRHPEPLLAEVRRVLAPGGLFVGQTSQFEPYHSFSFWNYTVYGFKTLLESAGMRVMLMRPGIDGFTLMERAYAGRPPEFGRWFSEESPRHQEIEAKAAQKRVGVRAYRKLVFAGQFVFVATPA